MLNTDNFKKYFSDAAWERLQEFRNPPTEKEIFSMWVKLFEEGNALLGEDARGAKVQDWAYRCHEFWERATCGDRSIQAGYDNAWRDQQSWPAMDREPIAHLKY